MIKIEPMISHAILKNPGIGFFAAPGLEKADSPLLPEERYRFTPGSRAFNHPDSGVGFVSSRWAVLEPAEGEYDWSSLDKALRDMWGSGRLAILRCAPYALGEDDVPAWLRVRNPGRPDFPFWQIDPNSSDYAPCWARFIRAMAAHLDGHPYIFSLDMALVGAWGEGGGTEFLKEDKLHLLIDAYMDSFQKTQLQCMLHDPYSLRYIRSKKRPIGFRVDCLGDMGGFHGSRWSHMLDFYPQNIQNFGMDTAWKQAPVVFEACWTMQDWFRNGWDIDYIIEESLKWHISSFNNKGTPVPIEWRSQIGHWVKKMGYRMELRRILQPGKLMMGEGMRIRTLWCNTGAAPCYSRFELTYRLCNENGQRWEFPSSADLRTWMPGEDVFLDEEIKLYSVPAGLYSLSIGIVSGLEGIGPINIACEGCEDGFVPAGEISLIYEPEGGE